MKPNIDVLFLKNGQVDVETSEKLLSIFRKYTTELSQLASKAASSSLDRMIDSAPPEVKEKFQGGWEDFKKAVDDMGLDAGKAKEIIGDTTQEIMGAAKNGMCLLSLAP